MGRIVLLIGGLLLLLGLTSWLSNTILEPRALRESSARETVTVHASELYQRYVDNAIAADASLTHADIVVDGLVKDIGQDISGQPYLVLGSDLTTVQGVQVMLENAGPAATLRKGDSVTVRCERSSGHVMIHVILRGCVIR